MGVTVQGVVETENMFVRVDANTKKRVTSKLVAAAHEVQDLAKRMAPRDHANLEEAIKVDEGVAGARDEMGRFTKREISVFVDTDMPVPQRPGKTVGDYAYEMHEHLEYGGQGGPLHLGPESQQKQADDPSVIVGGQYLTRAMEQIGAEVIADLAIDLLAD